MSYEDDIALCHLGHDEACRAFDVAFARSDLGTCLRLMIRATEYLQEAQRLEAKMRYERRK